MNKFKVGDKIVRVVCGWSDMPIDSVWEVSSITNDEEIQVSGKEGVNWLSNYFELVEDEPVVNKFKAGDEVELVSLINTDNDHGVVEGMLNVGDKGFVEGCDGYTVYLKDDNFFYHIQDFKLVKSADEINTSQNEANDMFLESDVLLPKNDEDDFTCCLGKGIETKTTEEVTSDGGSSSYYFTKLPKHLIDQIVETGGIEIKDIIRYVFDNNADAFNIIKAQKRIIEHSKGKGKAGITGLYDAKKITFFANEQYEAMKNKEG